VGRRCDACQTLVPPYPTDEEIDGEPCSLIEHRWSAHGIRGVTRCRQCGVAIGTASLTSHLRGHAADRQIPDEFDLDKSAEEIAEELGEKITEVGARSPKPVGSRARSWMRYYERCAGCGPTIRGRYSGRFLRRSSQRSAISTMMPPTAIMRCDWDMYLARRTATTPHFSAKALRVRLPTRARSPSLSPADS